MHHFHLKLCGVYWTAFVKHSTVDFLLKISFNRTESPVDLCRMRVLKEIISNNKNRNKESMERSLGISYWQNKKGNFSFIINLRQILLGWLVNIQEVFLLVICPFINATPGVNIEESRAMYNILSSVCSKSHFLLVIYWFWNATLE